MDKIKKTVALLLVIVTAVTLVACKGEDTKDKNKLAFYYISENENRIVKSYKNMELKGEAGVLECIKILARDDSKAKRVFTSEIMPNNVRIVDDVAIIDFPEAYYQLPAKREVLTRAATVLTFTQIEGVNSIAFTVENQPYKGTDGKYLNAMFASDFITDYGVKAGLEEKEDFILYFANSNGKKLKEYKLDNVDYGKHSREKFVVLSLLKGPKKEGYLPTLSDEVKLNNIVITNKICYVDFSSNFNTERSLVANKLVIYSIVNSLSELDQINKVQISIDGDSVVKYKDDISLEQPFIRNLNLIEK